MRGGGSHNYFGVSELFSSSRREKKDGGRSAEFTGWWGGGQVELSDGEMREYVRGNRSAT